MDIFAKSDNIISEVINRVLNCRQLDVLYKWGNVKDELNYLYPAIKTIEWDESIDGDVVYARMDSIEDTVRIEEWFCQYRHDKDFIIYVQDEPIDLLDKMAQYGMPYPLKEVSALSGYLFLIGQSFDRKDTWIPDEKFKVLAIMHFYNEVDILEQTIEYLLGQDVDVYLLDNWSDDGSYEIACKWKEQYPTRVYLEHFPKGGKTGEFELYKQMEVTEHISKELDYNWFIHYDADEIRMTPWRNISFRQAIYWIDCLGYNCIENTVVDFRLTDLGQGNIFGADTYFEFRLKFAWFNHLKTWKKTDNIDLKSTAGHTLKIKNPKVFPLKFLNRHYPLRTLEQAERKIFKERIPRFAKEKEKFGWHGHYDKYLMDTNILADTNDLLIWKATTYTDLFLSLFMECGLKWDEDSLQVKLPDIKGKRIVIYGAGNIGKRIVSSISCRNHIVKWVDVNAEILPNMYGIKIENINTIKEVEFDNIIIAIKNQDTKDSVKKMLISDGLLEDKIINLK